jgi:hypothetical protein
MSCATPLSQASIVDYWAAALTEAEEAEVEEHVFSCDACAHRLEQNGELTQLVRKVVIRRGGMNISLTRALLDRLEADGLQMRHYRLAPGEQVACRVAADDDLVVTWLAADLAGIESVALTIRDGAGNPMPGVDDAPIDRAAKQVIYAISGDFARQLPTMTLRLQLVATEAGRERVLGDYTLMHTAERA